MFYCINPNHRYQFFSPSRSDELDPFFPSRPTPTDDQPTAGIPKEDFTPNTPVNKNKPKRNLITSLKKLLEAFGGDSKNVKSNAIDIVDKIADSVAEGGVLPPPSAEDAGKTVVVDEDGKYELAEASSPLPVPVLPEDVGKAIVVDKNGSYTLAEAGANSILVVVTDDGKNVSCNYTKSHLQDLYDAGERNFVAIVDESQHSGGTGTIKTANIIVPAGKDNGYARDVYVELVEQDNQYNGSTYTYFLKLTKYVLDSEALRKEIYRSNATKVS